MRTVVLGVVVAFMVALSGCTEERQPELERLVRDGGGDVIRVSDAYPEPWDFVCVGYEYQKASAVIEPAFGPGFKGDFEGMIFEDHSSLFLVETAGKRCAVKMLSGRSRIAISGDRSRVSDKEPICLRRESAVLKALVRNDPGWTHLTLEKE